MNLDEATTAAAQILYEEKLRPTIGYTQKLPEGAKSSDFLERMNATLESLNRPNLTVMRNTHPRLVLESPELFVFGGTTFDLLLDIFRQLPDQMRDSFIDFIVVPVAHGGATSRTSKTTHFPTLHEKVSNLPLIAEFCVRTGYVKKLMEAAQRVKAPTVAFTLMMMQLEETIALNFNCISCEDLWTVIKEIEPIRQMAASHVRPTLPKDKAQKAPLVRTRPSYEKIARYLINSLEGIDAECRQARYFYVKHSIQQNRSIEVESDKRRVVSSLKALGFNSKLERALEEAEKEYLSAATGFELKNCLTHLRSFLEDLHAQSCEAIGGSGTPRREYNTWGLSLAFLRKKGFLSIQEEKLVAGIYAVMSESGVHPLIAEPEYVRLLRNMVIEYGLLLLTILKKNGIKIS
jgi:hypothetical protein